MEGTPVIIDSRSQALQERYQDTACRDSQSLSISHVTPWRQMCGNAEYAQRLSVALERFATVTPFDLRNFADDAEMKVRANRKRYFADLINRINQQNSDLVHIQHEFCFFGTSIGRSNAEFLRFVRKIKAPIVVTLHTWICDQSGHAKRKRRRLSPWTWVQYCRSRLNEHALYQALTHCAAIVVHTDDTHGLVATTYPKLRKKLHTIQIPISPVDAAAAEPCLVKSPGDVWVMQPGFVSRYKGHQHAIAALQHLPPNFKLIIAGGRHPKDRTASRYWMELLSQIESLNLQSQVYFTGFMSSAEQQAAVLRQADMFLLPYDEVGQSGSAVLADSLAQDRPVITSHARSMFAYRMMQDTAYSSISVDVANDVALAQCIKEVASGRATTAEVAIHRSAAISRFSLESIGSAYQKLYERYRSKA